MPRKNLDLMRRAFVSLTFIIQILFFAYIARFLVSLANRLDNCLLDFE